MQTAVESKTDAVSAASRGPLRCVECEQTLSQQRYILHDDQPHCVHCYETKYANVCAECGLLIATDSKVTHRGAEPERKRKGRVFI